MKIKDKARLRRILYNKYWFIKYLDNSNIFSHLLIMISVLMQFNIVFVDYESFMITWIYVSMAVTSFMLILFYLWLFAYIFIKIIYIYEFIKYLCIKINNFFKDNKNNGN